MLPHLRLLDRRYLHVGRLFRLRILYFPRYAVYQRRRGRQFAKHGFCRTRRQIKSARILTVTERILPPTQRPVHLSAVPEPAALEIQQLYGCPITELPDWGDYLYNAVDLATLVGHRFNKKRNRVNKFKSTYPDYRYEMITSQNLPEITAFFETYKQEYQKNSLLFTYEESKVVQVLHEYEKLKFEGGALRVSGQIVAFSIGEVIGDTLIVHIEKARKEVAGVYEAINQFYSAQMVEKTPRSEIHQPRGRCRGCRPT